MTLASLFWPVVIADVLDVQIDSHIVNTQYSGTVEQKDYIFLIKYDHENIYYQNTLFVGGAYYRPETKNIKIKMNPANPEEIKSYYIRWDYIFIFLLLGLLFIIGGIIKLFQN